MPVLPQELHSLDTSVLVAVPQPSKSRKCGKRTPWESAAIGAARWLCPCVSPGHGKGLLTPGLLFVGAFRNAVWEQSRVPPELSQTLAAPSRAQVIPKAVSLGESWEGILNQTRALAMEEVLCLEQALLEGAEHSEEAAPGRGSGSPCPVPAQGPRSSAVPAVLGSAGAPCPGLGSSVCLAQPGDGRGSQKPSLGRAQLSSAAVALVVFSRICTACVS